MAILSKTVMGKGINIGVPRGTCLHNVCDYVSAPKALSAYDMEGLGKIAMGEGMYALPKQLKAPQLNNG